MAIKKSELYSSLWKSCDELRGSMDASQYKDYVLVLLFVKYVSDKYAGQKDSLLDVPAGGGFTDMVRLKGKKDIGEGINIIIGKLAEANDLKGVIDVADFNDPAKLGKGQEMVDRLSKLVGILEGLNFEANRADGDDLLGDAYEYLMRNFATQSGKSKGQFYTPAEVSRVMAKVIGIAAATRQSQSIHDPTCGSGSLLLKAADESGTGITIYGQENDNATAALARMNMILHDNPAAEVWKGNSLSSPHFLERDGSLKVHDFVVANPPFSDKAWGNGFDPANDLYGRFADGIPPARNGDYAFMLHVIKSLKSTGKGAIIMPHGVLFRGGAEGDIRKNVIRRGYIKGIIGLPPNLFYGTGIAACIVVLDKEHASTRAGIFMIDASKGFVKDGSKNRLRHQDIHKIVDVFNRQLEIPGYSRMVSVDEISSPKNDYNLNIPRYIDSSEPEDIQDIDAHLRGGIPNTDIDTLGRYWEVFPTIRKELFEVGTRAGYTQIKVAAGDIKPTTFNHPEFSAYTQAVKTQFADWLAVNAPRMKDIRKGDNPKMLIEGLSESILEAFAQVPLIDPYDLYQHLMSYWTETMQDDVYMLAIEGWPGAAKLRLVNEDKEKKTKEKADFVVGKLKYKADFIPPALIVARFFPGDKSAIEALEAELERIVGQIEEMEEEHGGEGGLLFEAKTDNGKLTKASIGGRLKEIKLDKDAEEERKMLRVYAGLMENDVAVSSKLKEAQEALARKLEVQYPKLSEDEIKILLVDDKWVATLAADVQAELDRVSQALSGRIKQLAERYAEPLPQLTVEVSALAARVNEHLKKMGFEWN